jgi:hypothetical protein
MAIVRRDLDAAREESRHLAPELDAEIHSALLRDCGLPAIIGPVDEQPQPTLAMKPSHEARFRQTMDGFSHPGHLIPTFSTFFRSALMPRSVPKISGTVRALLLKKRRGGTQPSRYRLVQALDFA